MHIHTLPSGRHRWIVQYGGTRRTGTSPTKARAILDGSQALIELGQTRPTALDLTVAELLDAWHAERSEKWSPTYAEDMTTVLAKLPADFTGRQSATVTPPIVASLYRSLAKAGWSAHRVGRVHSAINGAWKLGVAYGWVHDNPARDLSPPAAERPNVHAPEHGIVRAVLDTAPDRLKLVLRLAVITGARLGELVALRWEDIDGDTLTIRRAVVYTPRTGVIVRDQTKTGRRGDRRLELDEQTLYLLDRHRYDQETRAAEQLLPVPVYVFSHDLGISPWRPGYVGLEYRRHRRKIPGAEQVRFHDIRHYVATSMLQDGEAPIDVAAQLGHATPATTLRVYAQYLPGRGGESARRRAQRLDG